MELLNISPERLIHYSFTVDAVIKSYNVIQLAVCLILFSVDDANIVIKWKKLYKAFTYFPIFPH
jgi:hypothetical protein